MSFLIFIGKIVVSLIFMLLVMIPTFYVVYRWGTYLMNDPQEKLKTKKTTRTTYRKQQVPKRNYNKKRNSQKVRPIDELRQRRHQELHEPDNFKRKKMG